MRGQGQFIRLDPNRCVFRFPRHTPQRCCSPLALLLHITLHWSNTNWLWYMSAVLLPARKVHWTLLTTQLPDNPALPLDIEVKGNTYLDYVHCTHEAKIGSKEVILCVCVRVHCTRAYCTRAWVDSSIMVGLSKYGPSLTPEQKRKKHKIWQKKGSKNYGRNGREI